MLLNSIYIVPKFVTFYYYVCLLSYQNVTINILILLPFWCSLYTKKATIKSRQDLKISGTCLKLLQYKYAVWCVNSFYIRLRPARLGQVFAHITCSFPLFYVTHNPTYFSYNFSFLYLSTGYVTILYLDNTRLVGHFSLLFRYVGTKRKIST